MESYLVISPMECTWQKDAHLIFPGEWCYKYTQKDLMSTLDCEVDGPEELSGEESYRIWREMATTLTRETVQACGGALNRYHGINEDYAYWDFVLGKKIRAKLSTCYMLYWRIARALKRHSDFKVKVLSDKVIRRADDDRYQIKAGNEVEKIEFERFVDASKILKSIQENYGFELVEMDGGFVFEEFRPAPYKESASFNHKIYKLADKLFLKNAKIVGFLFEENVKKTILKTHGLYTPVLPQCVSEYQLLIGKDFDSRKELRLNFGEEREFYRYLSDWMPYELSTAVVEDYHRCLAYAKDSMPKAPLVANLVLDSEEHHMVMYGEWKRQGTVFSRTAHSLGDQIWEGVENYEEGVDLYYIWSSTCGGKYRSMPSYKSAKRRRHTFDEKGKADYILWCGGGGAETDGYSYYLKYDNTSCREMKKFLVSLDAELKRKLVYRPRDTMNWGAREYFKDIYPNLMIDEATNATNGGTVIWQSFHEACCQARVVVLEQEHTGVLGETLSINKPLVIVSTVYADNIHYYREGVGEKFDELSRLGFFYTDPLEAARFINDHYDDIDELWRSAAVQNWRREFIDQYMYEIEDVDKWVVNEVRSLIKKYHR